jgi:hypothetical protein
MIILNKKNKTSKHLEAQTKEIILTQMGIQKLITSSELLT